MRHFGTDEPGDTQINRLFVEERNLFITPDGGRFVHVYFPDPKEMKECETIGDVDIPDDLVDLADRFARMRKEVEARYNEVCALIKKR